LKTQAGEGERPRKPKYYGEGEKLRLAGTLALPNGHFSNSLPGPFLTQKAAADTLLDRRFAIGPFGYACTDFLTSEIQDLLMPVYRAYDVANNGQHQDDPSQLLPFATTPEQRTAVQKLVEQAAARK